MGFKIAVLTLAKVGHMNPMLAMVEELAKRGVEVTVFCQADFRENIEGTGAKYLSYYDSLFDDETVKPADYFKSWRIENGLGAKDRIWLSRIQEAYLITDRLLERVQEIQPDAILYDVFLPCAYLLHKLLDIPLISHVSFSGLGILGDGHWDRISGDKWIDVLKDEEVVEWNNKLVAKYGVDLFEENLPLQYYSKELILTTMIPELCLPLCKETDTLSYKLFAELEKNKQVFVGHCSSETARISGKNKNMAQTVNEQDKEIKNLLEEAKSNGKKILLVSFGTVITEDLWEDGAFPVGGFSDGKEFFKAIMGRIVEGFSQDSSFLVLVSTGIKANGLENDNSIPSNFVVRSRLPQTQTLKYADAFISHMGANSMNEALSAGVPLVPMPGFADQSVNSEIIIREHAGLCTWFPESPAEGASAEAIRSCVVTLMEDKSYATGAALLGSKNRSAGGQAYAADVIINHLSQKSASSLDTKAVETISSITATTERKADE